MMNKTKSTPKDLLRKRISNNKLLRIPKLDCDNNEIKPVHKKRNLPKRVSHDREVTIDTSPNPYNIPDRMRCFTKCSAPRKYRPEPDVKEDVRTICDIYPEFYSAIEGRPMRQSDDIKVYMQNIKNVAFLRTNGGFLKDEMERIDADFRNEIAEYKKIRDLYHTCSASFVKFLESSFLQTKSVCDKAAEVANDLDNMTEQLSEYSFQYVKLRNETGTIVSRYEILLRYKTFLTSLAPQKWQEQYGNQGEILTKQICSEILSSLDLPIRSSVQSLVSAKPHMFFKQPEELMRFFDNVGRQGQHYMEIVNNSSGILNSVHKCQKSVTDVLEAADREMQEFIQVYENNITFMEEKEAHYETAFFKILMNDFQRLYADFDNIKIHTCVQYVHTRLFGGPEDHKDVATTMMRNIEGLYMTLASGLDSLDIAIVEDSKNHIFMEDIRMMNRAHKAQRELQMCNILEKALRTSFEPPRRRTRTSRV